MVIYHLNWYGQVSAAAATADDDDDDDDNDWLIV